MFTFLWVLFALHVLRQWHKFWIVYICVFILLLAVKSIKSTVMTYFISSSQADKLRKSVFVTNNKTTKTGTKANISEIMRRFVKTEGIMAFGTLSTSKHRCPNGTYENDENPHEVNNVKQHHWHEQKLKRFYSSRFFIDNSEVFFAFLQHVMNSQVMELKRLPYKSIRISSYVIRTITGGK